jgi:hypothetical protein
VAETVESCGKVGQQIVAVAAGARLNSCSCQTNDGAEIAALRACSACAGDYEDPERTAWPVDEEAEDERKNVENATVDEFPAEEA